MRLLLDTCVLLWMVGDPDRLPERVQAELTSPEAEPCISAISGFEIAIKHRKGKLELPLPPREWVRQALAEYSVTELPVTSEIAALAPEVRVEHSDPCDRMIVATAQLHRITVVTPDEEIAACEDIEVLW